MSRRPSIRLQSGSHWFFDHPETSQFTLEDIAHNIAKEPRFNGANDGFIAYSVAQHEVNASLIAAPGFELEALHHDDAEGFYKDITTWLKGLIPDYRAQLKRGELVIARHFGLPEEESPEVKKADLRMLKMEKLTLFSNHNDNEGFFHLDGIDVEPWMWDVVDLNPWPTEVAYNRWLARHKELTDVA